MKTLENRDGWTQERDACLRRLWDEGLTGSQIAQQLRITRSAVLARARRIRCATRISAESKALTKPRKKPNTTNFNFASGRQTREPLIPKEPFVHCETVAAPEAMRVPFEALEAFDRRCRYPHGEAHPYTFCGLPTAMGTSWCVHHLKAISPPLKAQIEAAQAEAEPAETSRVLEAVE